MKSLFFLAALAAAIPARAQSTDKAAAIQRLVESKNYVFRAQTAMPQTGQVRNLTSIYDLKIRTDAIVSDLPYFGRAYAPVDPNEGGIQFTSKDFTYTSKPKKKGGVEITIKPNDIKADVKQMWLTITTDGYATLRVICNNRNPISFNGQVFSPDSQ
jgi:Domain of unknown function (DUF4251)